MSKLKDIVTIAGFVGIVGIAGCASTGISVPTKGPIDENASYDLTCYDKNNNGLCDGYMLEGPNVEPYTQKLDKERTVDEVITLLRKQGFKIMSVNFFQ